MKKFIRIAAMLIITAVFMGVLGCAQTTTTESQQGGTTSGTQEETTQTPEDEFEYPVTIKMLGGSGNFEVEGQYAIELLEEKLGVVVDYEMGNDSDRINLVISSNLEYDLIYSTDRALFASLISNNAIQDLTNEINRYDVFTEMYNPLSWDMVTAESSIYGIPYEMYTAVEMGLLFRSDWLEAVEMDLPQTPDDLYNVLKAFKENDPEGVGTNRVIPLTVTNYNVLHMNGLNQAFGLGQSIYGFVEQDGKLISGLELPGAKEAVTFLSKLYSEGLLDADVPGNEWGTIDEKLSSGLAGAAATDPWYGSALRSIRQTNADADLIYSEPLRGPNGERGAQDTSGVWSIAFVPRASEKMEYVVKFAADFINPDNVFDITLGVEGETYEKIDENTYRPILPEFDKLNRVIFFLPTMAASVYDPIISCRAWKEPEMGQMFDDCTAKSLPYSYPDPLSYAPPLPEVREYAQALNAMCEEALMKMILDESELQNFDAFVAEWKSSGGDILTDAYNVWYSETN